MTWQEAVVAVTTRAAEATEHVARLSLYKEIGNDVLAALLVGALCGCLTKIIIVGIREGS